VSRDVARKIEENLTFPGQIKVVVIRETRAWNTPTNSGPPVNRRWPPWWNEPPRLNGVVARRRVRPAGIDRDERTSRRSDHERTDVLSERGFIEQTTHREELAAYLAGGPATCYIGFDPTASSLHIGSLVPIMSLAHMQRQGHRPVALVGGGTGLVGDPSGKTEMRKS
jgi:hypothetical protein